MKAVQSYLQGKDLMNPHAVPLQKGILGRDLALQLLSGLYTGWPVVEKSGEVIGVVTEGGVLKALSKGKDLRCITAEEIMTTPPICVEETIPADVVLEMTIKEKLLRLPVVRNQKFVGVVARADLLHHLIAPESLTARVLPSCYWCEKVRDDNSQELHKGPWVELEFYLLKHQLEFSDVSLAPSYCPMCFSLVKKLMSEEGGPFYPFEESNQDESKEQVRRILVVDDEMPIARLLCDFLESCGFEVVIAANGREGLSVLDKHSVDGILLDLDMPIMDGRTMLDELRWLGYQMPVIVMSGGGNKLNLQSLLDEGAQGYLMKPFAFNQLEKIFREIFGEASACVPATPVSYVA